MPNHTITHAKPAPAPGQTRYLHEQITSWFTDNARELPWREPQCSPWGIMVSEFMLQQTPVVRVLPIWEQWMQRWPTPAALAAEPSGEALRAWGRLGYPRRALRLHSAAAAIVDRHGGQVPDTREELLQLPGVGTYTAAAIASFAFERPETVVDTNIRRVHARAVTGNALPSPSLTSAEMKLATTLMPGRETKAWNAAVMELGALVCTARSPKCDSCPVREQCAWVAAGQPKPHYVPKGQAWAGTDRQVRGAMMAVLREAERPVLREVLLGTVDLVDHGSGHAAHVTKLRSLGASDEQLARSLDGLLADGLAETAGAGVRLPN